jgi:hypothetical protein
MFLGRLISHFRDITWPTHSPDQAVPDYSLWGCSITYKVYLDENGQAVYAGDVTAPSYDAAVAFMLSEGYEEKDYILTRIDR